MHAQPAASEIDEDQLLNFIVNLLPGTVSLDIGVNAKIEPGDLWGVFVGVPIDGISISTLYASSRESPNASDVLYHLRTKADLDTIECIGNFLLQRNAVAPLPARTEFIVDLYLRAYYGDEAETAALYRSEAKAGTTAFHAYAKLYARARNKRYTLVVRRMTDGDTASDVLAEFLATLDGLDLGVKAVYLDREFYDSTCLALLAAHNYAYVVPTFHWGEAINTELRQGWSRVIEHKLAGTASFQIYIDAAYRQGRYDKHGVARHGYAAAAPFVDTPRQAWDHYAKRSGIEESTGWMNRRPPRPPPRTRRRGSVHDAQPPAANRVAVSSLGICVDAPQRWAAAVRLVVRGVHRHDHRGRPGMPSACDGLCPPRSPLTTVSGGRCRPSSHPPSAVTPSVRVRNHRRCRRTSDSAAVVSW